MSNAQLFLQAWGEPVDSELAGLELEDWELEGLGLVELSQGLGA